MVIAQNAISGNTGMDKIDASQLKGVFINACPFADEYNNALEAVQSSPGVPLMIW